VTGEVPARCLQLHRLFPVFDVFSWLLKVSHERIGRRVWVPNVSAWDPCSSYDFGKNLGLDELQEVGVAEMNVVAADDLPRQNPGYTRTT